MVAAVLIGQLGFSQEAAQEWIGMLCCWLVWLRKPDGDSQRTLSSSESISSDCLG